MHFVDTHSHLYAEEFDADREQVVERALQSGVGHILLPDVEISTREAMMAMATKYDCCYPMVGLHPTSVNDNPAWREELAAVEQLLQEDSSRYIAVGEVGMDLYWSRDSIEEQKQTFARQIELALQYNLPLDIHVRDAWEETIEVLSNYREQPLRGVIHAFSGDESHYRRILELGDFLFGIGGVVTFKRSALASVVSAMSLEHLVLETDAPYLTPVPHRGKRNESAYIPHIAEMIAQLQVCSVERIAEQTTANAMRMFGIKVEK